MLRFSPVLQSNFVLSLKNKDMETQILGIHHITAIAGNAKKNFEFYTKVLGLRLVKKTVNFDDPNTYHFYYGNETGSPGTILTFFPWEGISAGRRGTRQVTEIGYSVPKGSLTFWQERFEKHHVIYNKPAEKFGERYLTFLDPDGLKFELTEVENDLRPQWLTSEIAEGHALYGFHHVTITTSNMAPTATVLTDLLGYRLLTTEVNRSRFVTDHVAHAAIVDIVEAAGEPAGQVAAGSVHHIAFRVKDEDTLMFYRNKALAMGLNITEKIDRNYFYSLYFREPGGVLFEIATDNPGFTVDESLEQLGTNLKLPTQYETHRKQIEEVLPKLI